MTSFPSILVFNYKKIFKVELFVKILNMVWNVKSLEKPEEESGNIEYIVECDEQSGDVFYIVECNSWECSCIAVCDHRPTYEEIIKIGFCKNEKITVRAVKFKDILNQIL